MRKILLTTVLSAAVALAASAQGAPALLIPGEAGTLALGMTQELPGNYEVLDASVTGGLWAPATASNTYLGAKVGLKLSEAFALHIDGKYFKDKAYDITSATGQVTGSYTPADMFFSVGASYRFAGRFSLRLDGRVISSALAPEAKATGFCADLTAGYGSESYTAVLAVRNLGPGLDYGGGADALPSLVTAAGSVSPVEGLRLCVEADYLLSGALMAGLGAEYRVADIVALRAGYHYGDAQKALSSYASLGLGASFAGVSLDLAFLTASETLGNTLMFGLGYSF